MFYTRRVFPEANIPDWCDKVESTYVGCFVDIVGIIKGNPIDNELKFGRYHDQGNYTISIEVTITPKSDVTKSGNLPSQLSAL